VHEVISLAPVHVPATLRLLDGLAELLPGVVQVPCPDTAFHTDLPDTAATYAVPAAWRDKFGLRRYGFHGLSYAWSLGRTADLVRRPKGDLQFVAGHLGGGASIWRSATAAAWTPRWAARFVGAWWTGRGYVSTTRAGLGPAL